MYKIIFAETVIAKEPEKGFELYITKVLLTKARNYSV